MNVTNCSGVEEGHLLAESVPEQIGSHPEVSFFKRILRFGVKLKILDFNQPGQPALLHDGVHEDVAGVKEGGAKLRQEQARRKTI